MILGANRKAIDWVHEIDRVSAAGLTEIRHLELPEEVGTSLFTAVK